MEKTTKIPLFRRCVIQNFPFIEEDFDALTDYGLLCKVVEYLNKVINQTNINSEQVQALAEYVEHYFDSLDIQEKINEKLDEMAADGTLAELINEKVFEDLEDGIYNKNDFVELNRVCRVIRTPSRNPNYQETDYGEMQGGCYVGDNKFIQCSMKNNSTDNVKIEEIDLTDGSVIRSTIKALQHANSVTYNDSASELYITSLTYGGVNTKLIYVLDYETLALKKTIDLSEDLQSAEGTHSISYDPVTGKTYLAVETRTTNVLRVFEIDIENETLTLINLEQYLNILSGGGTNDICAYDNHLYILKHMPCTITQYNLVTGKVEFVHNLPINTYKGYYVGEAESISYDPTTDNIYVGSTAADCDMGHYMLYQYFIANFGKGYTTAYDFNITDNAKNKTVYVDNSFIVSNPTGNETKPFYTIGEALQLLNAANVESLTVNIKAGTYPYVHMNTSKTVIISGVNSTVSNFTVGGFKIYNSSNVSLINMQVNNLDTSVDYDIYVGHTNVYMSNITFTDSTKAKHILAYDSNLKVNNLLPNTDNMFYFQAENLLDAYDAFPRYKCTNNLPNITKKILIGSIKDINNSDWKELDYTGYEKYVETSNANLSARFYANYGHENVEFPVNTTDGGERNPSVNINGWILTARVLFDKTNKKLKLKITKSSAISGATVTDNASTATGDVYFYYAGLGNQF